MQIHTKHQNRLFHLSPLLGSSLLKVNSEISYNHNNQQSTSHDTRSNCLHFHFEVFQCSVSVHSKVEESSHFSSKLWKWFSFSLCFLIFLKVEVIVDFNQLLYYFSRCRMNSVFHNQSPTSTLQLILSTFLFFVFESDDYFQLIN